jgi:hypothetical protein
MQTDMDVVRYFYAAIDQGDLSKASQYLADDFQSASSSSEVLGKQEWLDVVQRLQEAMPNLKHTLSNITQDGPVVKLTIQAGGRHTRPLDLSNLRLGIKEGIVPGSGKMIIFQPDRFEYTIVRGKIKSERMVTSLNGQNGVNGFLSALGVVI